MAIGDRRAEIEAVGAERAAAVMEPQPDFGELLGLAALDPDRPAHAALIKRGPGRPQGARNKRAEALAAECERRFGNAIIRGYAFATASVDEVAMRLGCSPLEALQEQRLWLQVVAQYVHQRMPLALQHSGQVVHLTIGDVSSGAMEGGEGVTLAAVQIVENQSVDEAVDAPV